MGFFGQNGKAGVGVRDRLSAPLRNVISSEKRVLDRLSAARRTRFHEQGSAA
jgi:hypothetical protein